MQNDEPATEKQKMAVKAVFTETFNCSKLTMGQVSLLLDVTSYVNGVLMLMKKHSIVDMSTSSTERLIQIVAIEAVMRDEKLWKAVGEWGRDMYSLGRSSRLPDLDCNTQLFKNVFSAIAKHCENRSYDVVSSSPK
jgi:hypothetical protein